MANNVSPSPKSLAELLKADLLVRAYKKSREFYVQLVEGVHEAKERIEREVEYAEEELQIFDDEIKKREIDRLDAVKTSGLSTELMEAYNAFCESLNGPGGSQPQDGFSILCDQPHGGSYFEYDPEFKYFKECVEPERDVDVEFMATGEDLEEVVKEKLDRGSKTVSAKSLEMGSEVGSEMDLEESSEDTAEEGSEIVSEGVSEPNSESGSHSALEMVCKENSDADYNSRNFRCEASVSRVGTPWEEHIVEFWPLRKIERRSGVEVTWGEQYPKLYRLALQAAKNGSESVMEMLIRLPSMNAAFSGWLLEYEFAEELKDEFLLSRGWVFKQARNIDEPGTVKEKRGEVERLVAAY